MEEEEEEEEEEAEEEGREGGVALPGSPLIPQPLASATEEPFIPKRDPLALVHAAAGIPMERGFRTSRRYTKNRPRFHPDQNDLLEAYYFHSPHKFRPLPGSYIPAPIDQGPCDDDDDTKTRLRRSLQDTSEEGLPEPFEIEMVASAGGELAWEEAQYANGEWRRTAKKGADMREEAERNEGNEGNEEGLEKTILNEEDLEKTIIGPDMERECP